MEIKLKKQWVGATIIEILIVVIIMAILSAGVYVMWSTDIFSIKNEVTVIANDIRYTRNLSMATNSRYRIDLTSSTQYSILKSDGAAVVVPSTFNNTVASLPPRFTFSTSDYLVFDSKGKPYISTTSTGDGTAITADLVLTLSYEGKTETITITAETGRITSE